MQVEYFGNGEAGDAGSSSYHPWRRKMSTKPAKLLIWLVGVVVAAVVGQYIATHLFQEDKPSPPTEVHLVRLFEADGTLLSPYKENKRSSGECLSNFSEASSDPEATRCFAEHWVLDPCWLDATEDKAGCLSSPWDPDVYVVTGPKVSRTEPPPESMSSERKGKPWAIEVRDPGNQHKILRCEAIVGAERLFVAGMRRNWECHAETSGDIIGYAVGDVQSFPDRPSKVFFAAPLASDVHEAEVAVIWR